MSVSDDPYRRGQIRRLLEESGFWTHDPDADGWDHEVRIARLVLRYRSEAHPDRIRDPMSFRDWMHQTGTHSEDGEPISLDEAKRIVNLANPQAILSRANEQAEEGERQRILHRRDLLQRSDEIDQILAIPPHRRSKVQEAVLDGCGKTFDARWCSTPLEIRRYVDECLRTEGRLWLTPSGFVGKLSHAIGTLVMVAVALVPFLFWIVVNFLAAMLAAVICWWCISVWAKTRAERESERLGQWRRDWIARLKTRLIQEARG